MIGSQHLNWVDVFRVLSLDISPFLPNIILPLRIFRLHLYPHILWIFKDYFLEPPQGYSHLIYIHFFIFQLRKPLLCSIMISLLKNSSVMIGFTTFVPIDVDPLKISTIYLKKLALVPIWSIKCCGYSTG